MSQLNLYLLFVVFFYGISLTAQSAQIELVNCANPDNNSVFTASGIEKNGAPCFISELDPFLSLELSDNGWVFGEYLSPWIPCDDAPFASNLYSTDSNIDVTQVDSDGAICGASALISAVQPPVSIPTVGEWGVLFLFLLLLVFALTTLEKINLIVEKSV